MRRALSACLRSKYIVVQSQIICSDPMTGKNNKDIDAVDFSVHSGLFGWIKERKRRTITHMYLPT